MRQKKTQHHVLRPCSLNCMHIIRFVALARMLNYYSELYTHYYYMKLKSRRAQTHHVARCGTARHHACDSLAVYCGCE